VLTSPVYTIENAAPANVRITYNRWFSNNAGAGPNADTFLIEGRIDGGAWQTLELVGPGTTGDPNNSGTWVNASYTLADKGVATGNTLQLRFLAPRCNPPAGCDSIDFNGDGLFPDDADLVNFLAVLAGGACSTGTCNDIDFNNDGLFPDDSDLIAFLRVLAGGNC
jgi:hypothetical protein